MPPLSVLHSRRITESFSLRGTVVSVYVSELPTVQCSVSLTLLFVGRWEWSAGRGAMAASRDRMSSQRRRASWWSEMERDWVQDTHIFHLPREYFTWVIFLRSKQICHVSHWKRFQICRLTEFIAHNSWALRRAFSLVGRSGTQSWARKMCMRKEWSLRDSSRLLVFS